MASAAPDMLPVYNNAAGQYVYRAPVHGEHPLKAHTGNGGMTSSLAQGKRQEVPVGPPGSR